MLGQQVGTCFYSLRNGICVECYSLPSLMWCNINAHNLHSWLAKCIYTMYKIKKITFVTRSAKLTISVYFVFVTWHEKTGNMSTKYTFSYFGTYLLYILDVSYSSVKCIRFPMKCYINVEEYYWIIIFIDEVSLSKNAVKFWMHISPVFSCQVIFQELSIWNIE